MTPTQTAVLARSPAHRARLKLRQRKAVTYAASQRSERARKLRAKGMTWKEVANAMCSNSQYTARIVAIRNPKR